MLRTIVSDDFPSAIIERVFSRETATDAVAIAHGYRIQLKIKDGQLILCDGIGSVKRERCWPKVDRTLKRIVITGQTGYISLEAMAWCAEHQISIATLDLDGNVIDHRAHGQSDIDLLRNQIYATDTESQERVEIAKAIQRHKLASQASVIENHFSVSIQVAIRILDYRDAIISARTVPEIIGYEGIAANEYFSAWQDISLQWEPKSANRIPPNWVTFNKRSSVVKSGGVKQGATDPINAILNYCYTLGYAECRNALIAHGLDPRLGFVHSESQGRDSLACDALEMIRGTIDRYVITLVRSREFSHRDFTEPYGYTPGTCRLVAPLTHELCEVSYNWHQSAQDAVATITELLTGHPAQRSQRASQSCTRTLRESVTDILSDELWGQFESLLPYRAPVEIADKRVIEIPDRTIIAAMVWCKRNSVSWVKLPESFGVKSSTLKKRRRRWREAGCWDRIDERIRELV
jgi:CRISPR-associated protein Cas1